MAESYRIYKNIDLRKINLGQSHYSHNFNQLQPSDFYNLNTINSVLSILNKKQSGKIINIKNIDVINNDTSTNAFSNVPYLYLTKSTSVQTGYEVTPTKVNSSNSDVYAGVKVGTLGKSTRGNILRKLWTTGIYSISGGTTGMLWNGTNYINRGKCLYSKSGGDSTPIILNYGEGLTLYAQEYTNNNRLHVDIQVTDLNNGGFGTVYYSFDTFISKEFDMFSIFNNESGNSIKIDTINLNFDIPMFTTGGSAVETAAMAGMYSVCRVSGSVINTGDIIVPTKISSTNTLGDTGVEVKMYAKTMLQQGLPIGANLLPAIHRISGQYNSDISASGISQTGVKIKTKANKFTPIILNEGEGIGVFAEIIPFGGIHDLLIEYSIEEVSAPAAGGETGYAYA